VIIGVVAVGVVGYFLLRALRIVSRATSGGEALREFRSIRQPGMSILLPFADRMEKVDMREFR